MIVLILLGFVIVALLQIPDLIRNKWWREMIAFTILWFTGLILSIILSLGITLPPVTTIIGEIIIRTFDMY
jgi:hypothetical protein